MSRHVTDVPELVPVLSRGKHRNPRKGACFMELASYLAGERWSDHPACTHPLLSSVARFVNDNTSDAGRNRLIALVPSVIGMVSDELHVDARIALRAATTALPVVSAERQRVLAVGVFACERVLGELDGRPSVREDHSERALAAAPHATQWARRLTPGFRVTAKGFRRHSAPSIVRCAVEGVACACISNPDELLHELLAGSIEECARYAQPVHTVTSPPNIQTRTAVTTNTHTARAAEMTGRNGPAWRRR